MTWALRIALVLAAVALQVSWFGYVRPLGIMPNLMMIIVILAAMVTSASRALIMALVGGVLLDALSGADPGLRTAFLTLITLVAVAIRQAGFDIDSGTGVLGLVLVGTIAWNAILLIELAVAGGGASLPQALSLMAREALVNVVLAAVIRLGLLRAGYGLPGREASWRRLA